MRHSHGRPPERHQPRGGADPGQQHQPQSSAQGVLCAHRTEHGGPAVPGRPEQVGDENVSGHGGDGLRVPVKNGVGNESPAARPLTHSSKRTTTTTILLLLSCCTKWGRRSPEGRRVSVLGWFLSVSLNTRLLIRKNGPGGFGSVDK